MIIKNNRGRPEGAQSLLLAGSLWLPGPWERKAGRWAGSWQCCVPEGGAGSGGPAAFLGGAERLASVGNLGLGGGCLVSLAETVPVPVGSCLLGAISSSPTPA